MTLSLVGISHHVAPGRAARAGRARRSSAPPRSRARSATPSASRPATAPRSTSPATTARARSPRSRSSPASRCARSPTGCTTTPRRSTSSASSAGLDSLIPGESEILGQVRAAFDAASPGPLLDRVFRQALQLGKRVRTETAIGESPASVPAAAAALAAQVFGDLTGPEGAARRRRPDRRARRRQPLGPRRLDRLRREPQRRGRRELAGRFGGRAARPRRGGGEARRGRRRAHLDRRAGPRDRGRPTCRRGAASPLFFIDIAVPRDVDPAVHELDGCFLYDIDDLEAVVTETLAGRRAEAEVAERLVVEEAERFREWRASLDVVPAIASLRARAEEIRVGRAREARARCPRRSAAGSRRSPRRS